MTCDLRLGRIRQAPLFLLIVFVVAHDCHGQVSLDPSFGTSGVARFDFGGAYDDLEGLSVAGDGNIWAVGTGSSSNRFAVARLLSNGQFDGTFSGDGKLIIPSSAGSPGVHSLSDGKVLLGVPKLSTPRGFQAVRLDASGNFDSSFGVGGSGLIETPSQVYIKDLVVQEDNKILIGGYDFFSGDWNFVVTRFNSDGTPDNTFGTAGRVVTNFDRVGDSSPQDNLLAMAVTGDGHILAAGHSEYEYAMSRYLPNGTLDSSFGDNGKSVFSLGGSLEAITDLYPLSDGKFLATSGYSSSTALMRFQANGTLDTSFGTGGRIIAPTNAPWKDPTTILMDNQGRMLLGNSDSFSVSRLLADGSLDTSFGTNGTFAIDVGAAYRTDTTSLAWAPDGGLIVGGYSVVSANVDSDWHVARLNIGPPSPTQTVTLEPTFDVKAISGSTPSITDGETGLFIGLGFDAEYPEERPIFEFPLDAIPENAQITAATLKLDPYTSSGSPRVEAQGFAGDGLASLSDIDLLGTVLGSTGPVDASFASMEIELTPSYIQSLLGSSTHLGLRLRSLNLPLYVGFSSTEASFGTPPQLSLTYTMPTTPGDFNSDGHVDGEDLASWKAAYHVSADGDADGDGDTDGRDFLIWQRNYATGAPAAELLTSVPEPQSAMLVLISCACGILAIRIR